MAVSAKELSLSDLQRLMEVKKQRLDSLMKRRSKLQEELAKIEQEISAIEGSRRPAQARKKKVVRKRRRRSQPSMQTVLLNVLEKSKKGLSLADLAEKIKESGYKSSSSNFKNVVYQTLYKLLKTETVEHDKEAHVYRLKKNQA